MRCFYKELGRTRTIERLKTMDAQNQANPWVSERSLGSVGTALQCAEEAGVIRKVVSRVCIALFAVQIVLIRQILIHLLELDASVNPSHPTDDIREES